MTNEQARFILSAYRSGGHDASDPEMAEAMQQAQRDPRLRAWLENEMAHSAALSAKLREISPPAELRNAILAGARISKGPVRSNRWLLPTGLAAAACLLGAIAGFALGTQPVIQESSEVTKVSSLAAYVVEDARKGGHGGSYGIVHGNLRFALSEGSWPLRRNLSFDFDALLRTGCRTVDLAGHEGIEVCFTRDGLRYHLYAVRRIDCPDLLEAGTALTGELGQMGFVSWAIDDYQFIVVSSAKIEAIRDLVGPAL